MAAAEKDKIDTFATEGFLKAKDLRPSLIESYSELEIEVLKKGKNKAA